MNEAVELSAERVDLVPFEVGHLDELHRLWTDPDVRRFLWDDEVISREVAAEVIESSRASFREHGFGFWVVRLRETNESIGFAGLRRFGDQDEVELLYGLFPAHWGKGLATEASRRLIRFAFDDLGFPELFAGADTPNEASFRVMRRLGFRHHGERNIDGKAATYFVIRGEFSATDEHG